MMQQSLVAQGLGHCRGFTFTLGHKTLGRTLPDDWSFGRRYLYLTTHITHKIQTSMPPGGIRTRNTIKRATAEHALDPSGNGIGDNYLYGLYYRLHLNTP